MQCGLPFALQSVHASDNSPLETHRPGPIATAILACLKIDQTSLRGLGL